MGAITPFSYVAYGLNISSEFECPELYPRESTADVTFRLGDVPESLGSPASPFDSSVCEARPGKCLVRIAGVAQYLISNGNEIRVQPEPGVEFAAVRLFLLSTPIGALLHQREILPLHGSSVEMPTGAVAFLGPSGYGKSTLAGALYRRGYPVLSDDICAIQHHASSATLLAGIPSIMLWRDSAEAAGYSEDDLRPVRNGLEKFRIRTDVGFAQKLTPLRSIYILETHNSPKVTINPVRGRRKFELIAPHTFRRSLVACCGSPTINFLQITRLAALSRVAVLHRPRGPVRIEELTDAVIADS